MNILLRTCTQADKEGLKALCNAVDRRYLADSIPYPYTDSDAEQWLNMVQESEGKDRLFRAIVVEGKMVGSISVEKKADVCRIDGNIGYMLLTDYWSKGIMTQAVGEMSRLAFDILDLRSITALVYEPNIASAKVLEKNGYTKEATIRNAVIKDNHIYTILQYGLLRFGA